MLFFHLGNNSSRQFVATEEQNSKFLRANCGALLLAPSSAS